MFNRRLKIELDSLERRKFRNTDRGQFNDEHLVVKFKVYNRSLFRLKGDIHVVSGVKAGCWGPEVSDWEEIDLPGTINWWLRRFRTSKKSPEAGIDFIIFEIDRFSMGPFSFHVTRDFVYREKEFCIPLARRKYYVEWPFEHTSEDTELETGELVRSILFPPSIEEIQEKFEKGFKNSGRFVV